MVKLKGIYCSLSHNDVIAAVSNFGKTKSVVLFRSKREVRMARECASVNGVVCTPSFVGLFCEFIQRTGW